MLSDLYVSTSNWNEMIEMKSAIRTMRLKKNPAMSWIDDLHGWRLVPP